MMLLQEVASEGSTLNFVIGLLFVAAIIAAIVWWNTRCPRCNRPLAKLRTKENRSFMQHVTGKAHQHYVCKHCDYEWDRVVYVDR